MARRSETDTGESLDDRLSGHDPRSALFSTHTRAEQYSNWAERLKAKRRAAQEAIAARAGTDPAPEADYWSTEALFAESQRVAEDERLRGSSAESLRDLLGLFNLAPGASMSDLTEAYRRLAKLHHPDRYATADPQVRERHVRQMAEINAAYESLRQRLG